MTRVSSDLKARSASVASVTTLTTTATGSLSRSYRRKQDSVMASTSVSPDTSATAYSPRVPSQSDRQAAASSTITTNDNKTRQEQAKQQKAKNNAADDTSPPSRPSITAPRSWPTSRSAA